MGRTALVEIDFQPWILALPDPPATHTPDVVQAAVRVRATLRGEGAMVFATRYLSTDPADPLRSDPDGTGARFVPGLAPTAQDVVLSKPGRDIFENPDLLANLRCRDITDLVVDGLVTDGGVLATTLSALRLGFPVCVAAQACAGSTPAAHEAALAQMRAAGAEIFQRSGS